MREHNLILIAGTFGGGVFAHLFSVQAHLLQQWYPSVLAASVAQHRFERRTALKMQGSLRRKGKARMFQLLAVLGDALCRRAVVLCLALIHV